MTSPDFRIPDGGPWETNIWIERLAALHAAGELDEQEDDRPKRGRPSKDAPTVERPKQGWDMV